MANPLHIRRTLACGVAAWLLLAVPAAAQTTQSATDPDPAVPEARQKLEEVLNGVRGEWALRDEVVEAQGELDRAQRDFRAEHRRVVMRLRQDNPDYTRLQEEIVSQRQALHRLRGQRLSPPPQPRPAEEAKRRSDGSVVAKVGGVGRTSGRIMGESTNSRDAGLSPRERSDLEGIVREREAAPSRRPEATPAEQEAAAELLAIQAELDALEDAAILADALASEMRTGFLNAAERWDVLERKLAEEIQNDPDVQAARQALADARERAALQSQ